VINERCRLQKYRIDVANRVLLKEQLLSLLAPLPLRDVLEAVDVPPDQFGQLGRRLLSAGE
jgi:hypothetical protein